MTSTPVLEVQGLVRHYQLPRTRLFSPPGKVLALNGVDFAVHRGQSFGIVGESGCGKSTLARAIMGLERPTAGTVKILGSELASLGAAQLRELRRHFQMVFQDPYSSLDPRHRVGRIVAETLETLEPGLSRSERRDRVAAALESVGMNAADAARYPHEFSGGQRQRIAIARAVVTNPTLIVADEPVSALDVSVQAQVLNLLRDLRDGTGASFVFISHDLAVIEYVCEVAAVMYLGRIVEQAPTARLFSQPMHPYTRALLDSVPRPLARKARTQRVLQGAVVRQESTNAGCAFAWRCPIRRPKCQEVAPLLQLNALGHSVACHFPLSAPCNEHRHKRA